MSPGEPRIAPLPEAEWTEAMGRRTDQGKVFNGQMTFARNPNLRQAWNPLATYIRTASALTPRQRELVILRTGFRHNAEYEFSQHAGSGRDVGISEEELVALLDEEIGDIWDLGDAAVLQAADELYATSAISDKTWAALSETLSEHQLLDLLFTIGFYTTVSYATNGLRIEVDDFVAGTYPWHS